MNPSLSSNVQKRYPEYITAIRNKAISLQQKGIKVIRLESGDIEGLLPEDIEVNIIQALREGKTKYDHQCGIKYLRERVQEEISERKKVNLDLEDICVTNGGTGALFTSFFMTLNKGYEVILPSPYWSVVLGQIRHLGSIPVEVPLIKEFDLDTKAIERSISRNTKAMYINTPNNPTGALFSRENLEELASISDKHNLWVISDEAYEKIIFEGKHYSIFSLIPERTILAGSYSKEFQMTGLRIGYAATKNKELSSRFVDIARSLTSGIPTPTQYGLAKAQVSETVLSNFLTRLKEKRDTLIEEVSNVNGFNFKIPKASLFLFIDCSEHIPKNMQGEERDLYLTNMLLEKYNIAVCPGRAFGKDYSGFIRLAYSTPSLQDLREAGKKFKEIFGTKS